MKVLCTEAKMDEKGRRPENVDLLGWYNIVNKNRICTLLIYSHVYIPPCLHWTRGTQSTAVADIYYNR